ncbi:SDR family NAD(P)-dependent oxidoreductase [Mycolicibacterium sediminis]|uniref:3-oxoacyl-[acyl-carrier-protein] reductase MabA n=1 Tax=Mycolicibacterium sediminis TaxID=1286180 RepID=A0A7I7QSQ4_9MYCO|nr:SDR family oxidoreductase [Mycolicibacterium sediminis]BBY28896.1 short-chain dehydrogenase [Mycolicibacterium sediminis]
MSGRVVLVTGASRGIGAATATLLASRGARVAVNYASSVSDAESVVAAIAAAGGEALAVRADVRDEKSVDHMMAVVGAEWGTVDVLIHNALIPYAIKTFGEMTWEELGGKLDQEMKAAFLLTKAVLPGMIARRFGRIVYLGTGLSQRPREKMIALGTAKAALGQFARFVAQEVGPHGITVNVVSPGPVGETRHSDVFGPDHQARQAALVPLGRIATPDDVARVVAFYAGDDSGFVTGATASVNGGAAMD